jgi:hypothetical protein|tara:strand:+ start:152 stop:871 length:720 start_codon:yes stop_codon:yes gene_type:complete
MPRREGLRPIGDSVKKIIERIRKEREERQNKNKPIRTQPKLPGLKKGGAIEPEYTVKQEVKDRLKKENPKTSFLMLGLSPVTQFRKYKHRQNIKKERARDEAKVKKAEGGEIKGYESGGISRREEGRRRRPKMGLPSLPGKPKPQPKPGKPPRKKKDRNNLKNNPNFGVEFNTDGPARPGKEVTGYMVKKGGLIGGQKKLDANKDGKISGDDFKILRGKQNKMKGGGIAIRGTNFKGVY